MGATTQRRSGAAYKAVERTSGVAEGTAAMQDAKRGPHQTETLEGALHRRPVSFGSLRIRQENTPGDPPRGGLLT
jgi:hypothetical protein